MLVIENTVVSENIFRAKFLCDLERCRGACCVEGVVGAPLEDHERTKIDHYLPLIISTLSEAAREVIAKEGAYVWDQEYGLVTPTIKGGICVYGLHNPVTGAVECAFQRYHAKNGGDFPKPISCHLYPIRVKKTAENELLNYEQIAICSCARTKGKQEQLPLFKFLRTALIRKYGEKYFQALEQVYEQFFSRDKQ